MKETFKVFKFDDGSYFKMIISSKILATERISLAYWFGFEGNTRSTDDMKYFKGKFVTVTVFDEEQPTFATRKEPATFKGKIAMIKREQKLSEEALSEIIGCGKSTIHGWLHGSVPSRKFRKEIEELYKFYYEEWSRVKNE